MCVQKTNDPKAYKNIIGNFLSFFIILYVIALL